MLVAGGTALGQAIMLAAAPAITRLYTPEDFGVLSVFASAVTIILAPISLRFEVAIPLAESDGDAADLLVISLGLVTAVAAGTVLAILFLPMDLLKLGRLGQLRSLSWYLGISLLAGGAYQALSYWAIRKQAFRLIARTRISQSLSQAVIQIGAGLAGAGAGGLLLGDFAGRAGGTAALWRDAMRDAKSHIASAKLSKLKSTARRFRRFAQYSAGSALLNAATLQSPVLLLAAFYGTEPAGLLAIGQRILAMPMNLVGASVATVYYSSLAQMKNERPDELMATFMSVSKKLLLLGLPPVILVTVAGPSLCDVVFGSNWRQAGEFLRLITPMLLSQFVAAPLGGTLDVLERQDLHFLRELVRQVLNVAAFVLAHFLSLSATGAVALFAVTGTLGNLFYFGSTWIALREEASAAAT